MSNVEIVQGQLEAYNSRALDSFLSFYHQDVRIFDLTQDSPRIQGIDQMKELYAKHFGENPSLNCLVKNRIAVKSFVIDEEWVTGWSRFPEGLNVGA